MNDHPSDSEHEANQVTGRKPLSPQAQRALAEAAERRSHAEQQNVLQGSKELQGPQGPEPTRYGDWEHKGIASDF